MGRVSGGTEDRASRTPGGSGGGENDDGCERRESPRRPGGRAAAGSCGGSSHTYPPSAVGWNSWPPARVRWCCLARFQVGDGMLCWRVAVRAQVAAVSKPQRMMKMWSKGSQGMRRRNIRLGLNIQLMPIFVQR